PERRPADARGQLPRRRAVRGRTRRRQRGDHRDDRAPPHLCVRHRLARQRGAALPAGRQRREPRALRARAQRQVADGDRARPAEPLRRGRALRRRFLPAAGQRRRDRTLGLRMAWRAERHAQRRRRRALRAARRHRKPYARHEHGGAAQLVARPRRHPHRPTLMSPSVCPISTLTTSPMHRFLRPAAFLAVLLAGLPSLGAAQQQLVSNADNMMTVSQLREIADAVIADRVRRYGRDTDPQRRQDIGGVINAVQRTVGYDTHPLKWEIVMDSSLNAAAIPGGGMLINVGLSLYCDGYGRTNAEGNAERQRRLYLGCLAAVIGHEFGHLELGHTENVTQTVARRQEMQRRMRQAASVSAAVRDSVITASQRFERDQELAADRAGALYILRIGFEVQDAINLFDSMDRDERQSRQWRNQITWLGGHPRAAERVAELEIARGRLKLLQRDYDDAIALIEANELPDSALAMLDRVLEAFPTMAAANHARAV